jgi:hypothetical protein
LANRKTFTVDIQSILNATNYLDHVPIEAVPRLSQEIKQLAKITLFKTFFTALHYANSQGGFPAPFQEHVLSAVNRLPIDSRVSGTLIQITIDFEWLGTSEELSRAYHQGARLEDGGYLWGPYTGQALSSKDVFKRFAAWNAVYYDLGGTKFGKKSKVYYLPEWASWEATMQQRISIWGDKAPEWIFVQMGQQVYDPKIPVGTVFEDFEAEFRAKSTILFAKEIEKIMLRVNQFRAQGIPASITPGGRIRVPLGRFAGSIPRYRFD